MANPLVQQWLKEHGKGDLQECTWQELWDCLKYAGYTCPLAELQYE